ncbi:MAG: glycosyltransferase family 4 protein [Candidatus Nealsonbacteria bacterium]|nr:MAG: glycosyltransferase family 4 protein [Candidatus Nealsonbacteria bacterium]
MKVGLISFHSFSNPGGVKRHILGLFKEFKKKGIETKIIVPRRKSSENYGRNVILLGTSFPMVVDGSQSDFDIHFNPISIERTLRKEKFDVLHFHNCGLPSTLQILLSPSTSNTLNILTFHSRSKLLKKSPTLLYILNKTCRWKIDGVIGVAPLALDYFKDFKGLKTVIPNGIDLDKFNTKVPKIKKFCDGKTNILFVGRIEERKGLIYLIKAFEILQEKFSNLRLIIVGKGPLKKECKEYVKEQELKNVIFEGEKTKEVAFYYRTADIFVSPAIFGESFGLVLLEAMACGTPVVAFANKGYAGFLKGKSGERFLAKPKDYKGLAKKIEVLIKNPKLRKETAEQGIKEAKEYSWDKVVDRVLNFYELCHKNKLKKRKIKISLLE